MKNTLCSPWKKGAGLSTVIVGEGGEAIASIFPGRTSAETNERADLIISAPDLLAACKATIPLLKASKLDALALAKLVDIEAAIAKAEGRA